MNESMNHEAVYRTAPATQGLLIILTINSITYMHWHQTSNAKQYSWCAMALLRSVSL